MVQIPSIARDVKAPARRVLLLEVGGSVEASADLKNEIRATN